MTDKIKFTTGGEIYEMKMDSRQRSNVSPSIELTVERKMTDIEQKALALWDAVRTERGFTYKHTSINRETDNDAEALCRAIEQHEAFRQEVSDIVDAYVNAPNADDWDWEKLKALIIPKPKPDPLALAMQDAVKISASKMGVELTGYVVEQEAADNLRAALAARGLEIREKG